MISSNGTRGDIEDKLLFKHSLTIDSVKNRATSSTTTFIMKFFLLKEIEFH